MDLLENTRKELLEFAEKLSLKPAKNISDDKLRTLIETEAIRKTVELEEKVRIDLQAAAKLRIDIAEIQAEAKVRGLTVKIPEEPTLMQIIEIKKKLNMSIKEPKPSPETLAIEASPKVYAMFRNLEQKDMDVKCNPGGKYWFHFWPGKIHVIPKYLIGFFRKNAVYPEYEKRVVAAVESAKVGATVEKSVRGGDEQRFTFEVLGEAPDDAKFGIVFDEAILEKLKQVA